MIGEVTIGGKKFKTVSRYGAWRKLEELYPDRSKATEWGTLKFHDFCLDALLLILQNEPFKTREELIDALYSEEMQDIQERVSTLVLGSASDGEKSKN